MRSAFVGCALLAICGSCARGSSTGAFVSGDWTITEDTSPAASIRARLRLLQAALRLAA